MVVVALLFALPQALLQAQVDHWETIIYDNDNWSYFVPSSEIPNWNTLDFDASPWPSGEGGFGFGDNDDSTSIPAGTICLYQRIQFNVSDPSLIHQIVLNMLRRPSSQRARVMRAQIAQRDRVGRVEASVELVDAAHSHACMRKHTTLWCCVCARVCARACVCCALRCA